MYSLKRFMAPIIFFLCFCLGFCIAGFPQEAFAVGKRRKEDEKKLIEENKKIANKIDQVAQNIDVALAGKQFVKEKNLTTIVFRNEFTSAEGGDFRYAPHVDLNLHLPNLEQKWKLKFSSYDEDQESRVNKNRLRTTPRERNYSTSVGLLQKVGPVNVEFQPRVEFRNGLQLSQFLKMNNTVDFTYFTFNPEVQLFAKADSGVGEFVSLDIDIPLYKSLSFSLINEEQYVDRDNIFSTNSGGILGWIYNEKYSQNISLMFESNNRPSFHLERYTIATSFTHKVIKNVLHYTLLPYLAFPRYLDFKGSPGVNLEINVIF